MSDKQGTVSLRTVAQRVQLAPCSVSAILNHTPASHAIPQRTKDRVFRAAAELNYRPNLWARSLRTKRTRMIAAITSDIGLAPVARVLAGVQSVLERRGYLLILGSWNWTSERHSLSLQLQQRGIEGVVAIDAAMPAELKLPVASVDLDYVTLADPLADGTQASLSEWGEAAAEAVVYQIENRKTENEPIARRTPMKAPRALPSAYIGVMNRGDEVAERA